MPNDHGGKRKGAGRKPKPTGSHRVKIGISVSPETAAYLRSIKHQGKFIDQLIAEHRASK